MTESPATTLANIILDHIGDGARLRVVEHLDDTITVTEVEEGRTLFIGNADLPADLLVLVANKAVPHAGLTDDDCVLDVLHEMGAEVIRHVVVIGAQGQRVEAVTW